MCSESTLVPIPDDYTWQLEAFDATHPEVGIDAEGRKCFAIDSCIVPALLAIWAAGFKTIGCCCGHGSGHGVISLQLGEEIEGRPRYTMAGEHHCVLCGVVCEGHA